MGHPKAELIHQGKRFIDHSILAARAVAHEVVLLGDPHRKPAGLESIVCLSDPVPDAGPLAGLCSLLHHAGERWALLLACDMPLIDGDLLRLLVDKPRGAGDAVAFRISSSPRQVPCCLLVHPRVLPVIEIALQGNDRSIRSFLSQIRCIWIEPQDELQGKLWNINTPDDYNRLCFDAEAGGQSTETH